MCIFKELAPFKVADIFIFPPARNEDAASSPQIQLSGASTGKDGGSGPQIQCYAERPVAFFQKKFKFVSSVTKRFFFPLLISVHQWQLWVFPRDPLQMLVTWMPCDSVWISSILASGSWDDNEVLNCPQPLS